MGLSKFAEAGSRAFCGWRGGIGIAFSQPAARIADVSELGVDFVWGGQDRNQDVRWSRAMEIGVYRYFGCTVALSLKDREGRFDFSGILDREKAGRLAFDAYGELTFGLKGLSRLARIQYAPNSYGDLVGTYDLAHDNELVRRIPALYLRGLKEDGLRFGGIALDNAGRIGKFLLRRLGKTLHAEGFGVATNGCPEALLEHVDLFCEEKFAFSQAFANRVRAQGFRGTLAECPIRHLSAAQMESHLKAKLFNGIVFVGYTDDYGCDAARVYYSFYHSRPDVYNHHRWIFRRLVPLSRALVKKGRAPQSHAVLRSGPKQGASDQIAAVRIDALGRVVEGGDATDQARDPFKGTLMLDGQVHRYGEPAEGMYLFVNSHEPETVCCEMGRLGITRDMMAVDEFNTRLLECRRTGGHLELQTPSGPSLIQVGTPNSLCRNILNRTLDALRSQQLQRRVDRDLGCGYPRRLSTFPDDVRYDRNEEGLLDPLKPWEPFCQGYLIDTKVKRTGRASLKVFGGAFLLFPGSRVRSHNRQGAAQLVQLDQREPVPLVLKAWSRGLDVKASCLRAVRDRREHFQARLASAYCAHLYLDYQDGEWPEIHTVAFSPGTHDWEARSLVVTPRKPVQTAMVLLEFHQPEGTAWFDDMFLAEASAPARNLLACGGFEGDDMRRAVRSSNAYECRMTQLRSCLARVAAAPSAAGLDRLRRQIAATRDWVARAGLRPMLGREWRDLSDAERQADLCAAICTAPAQGIDDARRAGIGPNSIRTHHRAHGGTETSARAVPKSPQRN